MEKVLGIVHSAVLRDLQEALDVRRRRLAMRLVANEGGGRRTLAAHLAKLLQTSTYLVFAHSPLSAKGVGRK